MHKNKRTLLRIHAAGQKIPPPAARFVILAKHHGTPLLSGDVFQWAQFRNEHPGTSVSMENTSKDGQGFSLQKA